MNKTYFKQFLSSNRETVSPDVLRILSEITKDQADAFVNLCSLQTLCYTETIDGKIEYWDKYTILPIYNYIKFTYKIGLDFETIRELEKLGLIGSTMFGFKKKIDNERHPLVHFTYRDSVLSITDYKSNAFPVGNIMLTKRGKYLSDYFELHYYDEYMDMLKKFFYNKALRVYQKPLLNIRRDNSGNCRYVRINRTEIDEPTDIV